MNTQPELTSRVRFRLMLQQYPLLANYWNTPDDCLRYLELKDSLGVLSRGEQIMARFYMSVWRGDNHDFDFLDAAALLDNSAKKIVMTWFADPFWP
ncbi:TPA: hypothetical protein I8Y00_004865 [Citrobacter farmeri]|uniref:Uncharacterized protein n=3 Tax=Citrobacter TaxID=544 RepID=A0AAP9QHN1_CITFR|nr:MULTISPECIES: hypothetical protein [Enterobacteriaceae]EBS1368538.1 hypothetical protein [Salmonella enterica subsp. enterica serovar Virchow]HBB6718614.1 hypothetical protein [Serratia marcescens]EHK0947594.1 hypothetical protein [Citrobacter farmeri]EKT9197048.1 hypothetical protein [Citrobacter freundii]EKX4542938.1 hypothetical protein [Citrobacter farmeri]